jgi:hypothetical protein
MPQINLTQQTAPYNTVYVPFGPTSTSGGTAPATNTDYRMFVTTQPTYILGISILRATGTVDSGLTYQAGYLSALTATSTALATSNFGSTAVADTATVGPIDLGIEKSGVTDDEKPLLLPANTYVGFKAIGTASNARILGVVIKYRCP